MRKKILLSLGVIMASLCLNVNAGVGTGKIKFVKFLIANNILVVVPEVHSSKPACATWGHSMGIQYADNAQANAALTMLLAAQASGKTVRMVGSGACLSAAYPFEVLIDIEIAQ